MLIEGLNQDWLGLCFLTGYIAQVRFDLIHFSQGLIDIAISTVEDLYEDSGGLPNSLIFPRIEDIEAELDKTTVQDLRQAMTVQIVCSSVEALPGFAVPAMRKTFGLCGVVQDIDKVGFSHPVLSYLILLYHYVSHTTILTPLILSRPIISQLTLFYPHLPHSTSHLPYSTLLTLFYPHLSHSTPTYPILPLLTLFSNLTLSEAGTGARGCIYT